MPTPLIPQEVYLLERYSSLDYFRSIRDNWEAMIRYTEQCLDVFIRHLPPDYRSRHLSRQPDIVWGERVLPNFRETQQSLYRSYIRLSHGNLNGLGSASQVLSDNRGSNDSWFGWMDEPQVLAEMPQGLHGFEDPLKKALGPAGNVMHTEIQNWDPGDLSYLYDPNFRGPLDSPERWPRYRLNPAVQIKTGEEVSRSGVYLPDIDQGCAQLLIEGREVAKARAFSHMASDEMGEYPEFTSREATWTLVERIPGEFVDDGLIDLLGVTTIDIKRVPAGQSCPESGWWYTPAKESSRRRFQHGDVFPEVEGSAYGATFWLWSQDQSNPEMG